MLITPSFNIFLTHHIINLINLLSIKCKKNIVISLHLIKSVSIEEIKMNFIDSKNSLELHTIFEKHILNGAESYFDFAIALGNYYRQDSKNWEEEINIHTLNLLLKENDNYKRFLKEVLDKLISEKDFDQIISDSGIINYSDFFYEVRKRIIEKILPYQPAPDTLEFVLNQIFYSAKDPKWINQIPKKQLYELLQLLGYKTFYDTETSNHPFYELIYAVEVLTQRVTGRAMEPDICKMVPNSRNFDSPFIGLQRETTLFINQLREQDIRYVRSDDLNYKQLFVLLNQCEKYIDTAYSNANKLGISIKVNQSLFKVRQQLQRIKKVLPYLALDNKNEAYEKNIDFIILLITINCNKTDVSKLIRESTQSVAYEITQHKANTGEHYITSTKKEYINMLWSACGGGLIVGIMCIIKLLLGNVETSEFGHAFLYSMNYSIGFIAIYLLGGTLATKQPSMTASALASSLERNVNTNEGIAHRYWSFATFVSQVSRSQFIAFIGNIFVAFPIALFLIWGIDKLLTINIAASKWQHLLHDLDPIDSPAIFHASIAGIFLFLSGIIAGNVANRDKFNAVYYRIQQHPLLKKILGKDKTNKFAEWYKDKWAGVISNFWFGVFMGSTGSIGLFLGLDIDIRHITFASGNIALGIFGSDNHAPTEMVTWAIIGMIVIGFFNFIVSFTLSFYLAMKARKIEYTEISHMFRAVWTLFKINPKQFFFPPKSS